MLPYYYMTDADGAELRKEYINLFLKRYPGFLDQEDIKKIPAEYKFDEMILDLRTWDPEKYLCPYPDGVRYGWYEGDYDILREKVNLVAPHWVKYYKDGVKTWCAFLNDEVVSFCTTGFWGDYEVFGKMTHIGAVGCVGTIPEFRRRGIGLAMIHSATKVLKEEGYDYSFIHYTLPASHWYARMGYRSFVRWNGTGIVDDNNEEREPEPVKK